MFPGRLCRSAIFFSATLVASPNALFAQAGNAHLGGPAASGPGLSQVGRKSGPDQKDDLRDFHQIMAVQGSREQKQAFVVMMKSTFFAAAELQGFEEQLGKAAWDAENGREKSVADAVESARTLNKKFLEGFSEEQKSGLKEIIKRLEKADADLAQQAHILDQSFDLQVGAPQITSRAENFGRALSAFQRDQAGLGEEMSIPANSTEPASAYDLPAVRHSVSLGTQSVVVVTSGNVSKAAANGGQNRFQVQVTADLTDLQHSFTDILRGEINKSERCGEQIEVLSAALTAQQPSSLVDAQLHYERWTCTTMFGRENLNEVVQGNATIHVKLSPSVADDGTLRQNAQMERVDADGLLRESLRSGSLGEALGSKISDSVLSTLNRGADFKGALPTGARNYATLKQAHFQGTGSGRLLAVMDGEIQVSNEHLAAVTGELQQQSSAAEQSVFRPELLTR